MASLDSSACRTRRIWYRVRKSANSLHYASAGSGAPPVIGEVAADLNMLDAHSSFTVGAQHESPLTAIPIDLLIIRRVYVCAFFCAPSIDGLDEGAVEESKLAFGDDIDELAHNLFIDNKTPETIASGALISAQNQGVLVKRRYTVRTTRP